MAGLTWAPQAIQDLDDLCTLLARTSEPFARLVAAEARAVALTLPDMPRLGAKVPEYDRDDIRERQVRSYRLIYRLRDDGVEVVSFVTVNRRLPRTPPG